jgi:hypothetical protein
MIKLKCPHCPKEMNLGDDLAGKKIRCPACKEVVAVPGASAAVQPAPARKPPAPIQAKPKPPVPKRPPDDEDDEELAEVMAVEDDEDDRRPRKSGKVRSRDDEDDLVAVDEEEDDRPGRKRGKRRSRGRQGAYADCPGCGAPGDAKRVGFTWWGGALGPWILCHVRCNHCSTCYNGRSGKSNAVGITIYTLVGLFFALVLCVIGIITAVTK